ncbi:uncharacterized protein CcaverHIS019_0500270 [Cutaneotrichosporon cavernicola]|uniref:Alpha/beta hydrolase fold-3 domain-containing protein n=1 Tax=Cutaneotrichosporon cavernicola TaxID=279322 RepID=A0AA48QWF1_9TREE|nr:uncharacterized protein CcaverHIS019_0500270 [Cutaneotrichosporon cavernicola]BEI92399.1 hypothetical protein CcaverHIS019_0500270 [Cutaneotrichosporon cavernicola]BEJ00172.1 hypothetical protein CcaverHIS631_0500290 [Cutaneotrichosporon cavernicola]BEJ07943.1 hypothetical protein CcaverHIS641_0500280 [Cutaneotrichosporon cavernicola]
MAPQVSPMSTVANVAQAATAAASTLLRASPAPAPNGMPRWIASLINHAATLAVLPTLPYAIVQHTLYQPQQPLKVWLIAHLLRNRSNLAPILEACYSEEEAASIAFKPILPFPKGIWDDVKCEVVSVPPAPKGWAPIDAVEIPVPVEVATRPGFILTPTPKNEKQVKSKLIIHCHGGGYTRGHPLWTPLGPKLARDTRTPVLSVQYRKCVTEMTAFPAPLLDALAAYHYATHTLGYAARDIVLVGDSAGGNLVLAVMQTLSKTGQSLPRGVALSSPWCDLTFSHPSIWHNSYVDYLALNAGKAVVASVARHYTPSAIRGPLLSPALAPEGTWKRMGDVRENKDGGTRVFIQVGTGEGMYDEAIALADTMRGDGVRVEVDTEEGGLHCGALTGFLGEDAYTKFAEGTERLLRGGGQRRESMNIGEVADKALSLL